MGHHAWVDELKSRPDVETWQVGVGNRDRMAERILRHLRR